MILVAIPFFVFAAAVVLAGLSQSYSAQHGHTSGGFTGFLQYIISNSPAAVLLGLGAKAGRYVISRFAASQFRALTSYLNSVAGLWKAEFRAMRANARETVAVARALERAMPIEAHKAAAPALRLSRLNAKNLSRLRAEVRPELRHLSTAIDVTIPRDLAGIRQREKVITRDQAKLRDRTIGLEDGAIKVWDWLRSHPLSAAMGAFAGVTAIALSRLGLGWLRCKSNPFTKSKDPCGLLANLGRFLPALAFLTVAFDFQEFVDAAELVASGIGDAVAGIEGTFAISLPPLPTPQ